MSEKDFGKIAASLRRDIVQTLHRSSGSFAGGALSCIDILTVLFHGGYMRVAPEKASAPDRDIFIMSKGHASSALYATLASVGMFSKKLLETYGANGSSMIVHPKRGSLPGVDVSSGSLGHGLPLGTGSALAAKLRGSNARTFVLLGDGECNEGSNWENMPFAVKQRLNNLVVVVDRNRLQGCGRDCEVLDYGDMAAKFAAFGFHTLSIDGHNHGAIDRALAEAVSGCNEYPTAIIASTVKGKGVSFMEDRLEWHYKSPNQEQLDIALKEIPL